MRTGFSKERMNDKHGGGGEADWLFPLGEREIMKMTKQEP